MKYSTEFRAVIARAILALIAMLLLFSVAMLAPAAEPTIAVTFTASTTSANGQLSTRLTWSTVPAATRCTASGHPSWTGEKAGAGSQDLPPITLSGTYTLSISCEKLPDTQAVLSWTRPTQNTDGTALVLCASQTATGNCLRSYNVYHATSAAAVGTAQGEVVAVNDRNALGYTWTGLSAPGTHYFAVSALNGNGVESALSGVGSKVVGGSVLGSGTVTVTVNPKPDKPGSFAIDGAPVQ